MSVREDRKRETAGPEAPSERKDVVIAAGPTADRKGAVVLRAREGRVELGEMRPLEEGKPIHGELVRLRARAPRIFEVEETIPLGSGTLEAKAGRPAQVSNDRYRANWEAIYGAKSGAKPN